MEICSVPNCQAEAVFEARLYDVYVPEGDVFDERDTTCPFLCSEHFRENETGVQGTRKPRDMTTYPFTNRHHAQGFTIYRVLG